MAGLFQLLHVGSSALGASQYGIKVVGDNIANQGVAGFARRVARQTTAPGYVGKGGLYSSSGVRTLSSSRTVDFTLDLRARTASGRAAAAERRTTFLARADAVVAELQGDGVGVALDELFGAFDALALAPQDTATRENFLFRADFLAQNIQRYHGELDALGADADLAVRDAVQEINSLANEVAELNGRIQGQPVPPLGLVDQRARALDRLAELAGARATEESDGSVSVRVGTFLLVARDDATSLQAQKAADGRVEVYGQEAGQLRTLSDSLREGELGGVLAFRDDDLGSVLAGLDRFAAEFADLVNGVHSSGLGLDGSTGRDLFTYDANRAAATFALAPELAGQPDRVAAAEDLALLPGDNRVARRLAELRDVALPSGQTPGDSFRGVLTDLGDRVGAERRTAEVALATSARMAELRESVSGVSLDEEMTLLLAYRQSYAAAAQLVRTADELIQTTLTLKR